MVADKLVVGEVPGEPAGFVDRTELADLERVLGERGRAAVCAGGRGVGKSALAAAYASAAIADLNDPRVVVWVSAETELALQTGLAALADRVNLSVDGEDIAASAARARARDYLTGLGVPGLLVVDNAENPEKVTRWLPTGRACRVVLTSTDQAFTSLATPIPVGTYTRAQFVAFLAERTGLDDPACADQVADALGDLPLALAQAAGVIISQRLPYPRYLDKLTALRLERVLPPAPGYPRGLTEAIGLSVQAATDRHAHARTVLNVLALLDPNGVTRTLLTTLVTALLGTPSSGVGVDQDDVDEIIGVLAGASLITLTTDSTGVLMHRLIARSLHEAQTPQATAGLLDHLATALAQALPPEQAPPPAAGLAADLSAQTLALLTHTTNPDLADQTTQHICTTSNSVGDWLYAVGAYTQTLPINQQVLAARERVLGPEHSDTLRSRNGLAVGYRAVGRHQEAITLFEATLAARERVLGPEHPDTLGSRSNLAVGYRAVGRHQEAITLDEATLAARVRVLGPEHPITLTSRNNLALNYLAVGRHQEAESLLNRRPRSS